MGSSLDALRRYFSAAGVVLAVESFAVWALFALPRFTGRATIREAWDNEQYWTLGIPVLLISLALWGALSRKPVWLLALYCAAGHALATALIVKSGTDYGLLPLTVALVGAPLFAVFIGAVWIGRKVRSKF